MKMIQGKEGANGCTRKTGLITCRDGNHGIPVGKEGILAKDLLEEMNTIRGKEWKKQTLNTYLMLLHQKGLIDRISVERKYSYEAKMTKEEYEQGLLKDFIKTIYGGSMPKLLSAFVGIHAISEEEAEEIKKILEDK